MYVCSNCSKQIVGHTGHKKSAWCVKTLRWYKLYEEPQWTASFDNTKEWFEKAIQVKRGRKESKKAKKAMITEKPDAKTIADKRGRKETKKAKKTTIEDQPEDNSLADNLEKAYLEETGRKRKRGPLSAVVYFQNKAREQQLQQMQAQQQLLLAQQQALSQCMYLLQAQTRTLSDVKSMVRFCLAELKRYFPTCPSQMVAQSRRPVAQPSNNEPSS